MVIKRGLREGRHAGILVREEFSSYGALPRPLERNILRDLGVRQESKGDIT